MGTDKDHKYSLLHDPELKRPFLSHSALKWSFIALVAMLPVLGYLLGKNHQPPTSKECGLSSDVLFGDIPWRPVILDNDQTFVDSEPEARYENGSRISSVWDDLCVGAFVAFDDPSIGGVQGKGMRMTDVAADPNAWPEASEGYAVAVMHQLHCVISIKQALLSFQKGDHVGAGHDHAHLHHCVEILRQAVMCQADLSLEHPHDEDGTQRSTGWGSVHMCRDWSSVHQAILAKRIIRGPKGGWIDKSSEKS